MKEFHYPKAAEWPGILERPSKKLKKINKVVKPILKKVKKEGDQALFKYAKELDQVKLDALQVTGQEIQDAGHQLNKALKDAIEQARANIEKFHRSQYEEVKEIETTRGVKCYRKSIPISKVGLYIPGGTAPLFSTVLMLGIPAKIAGCKEIVLCTPPDGHGNVHPAILYTAGIIGIHKIFKTGGAQAIASMAYGTESIPEVDKIFGPGNQYVTAAKQLVNRKGIAIDMPAGPSEVAVFGDETADPEFVAADLLSQAEHGADSQVVLVTTSQTLLNRVKEEVDKQTSALDRKSIIADALKNSLGILVENQEEGMALLNEYAPEHLILAVNEPYPLIEAIENAGSVFVGHYTPEAAGDYASGTNHTLPTNGYARQYSGVSLDSFIKKVTFQEISEEGIQNLGPVIMEMAHAENLEAHKAAVAVRINKLQEKYSPETPENTAN